MKINLFFIFKEQKDKEALGEMKLQILKIQTKARPNEEQTIFWTIRDASTSNHLARAKVKVSSKKTKGINPPTTGWKLTPMGNEWWEQIKESDTIVTNPDESTQIYVQLEFKKHYFASN